MERTMDLDVHAKVVRIREDGIVVATMSTDGSVLRETRGPHGIVVLFSTPGGNHVVGHAGSIEKYNEILALLGLDPISGADLG